MTREQETDLLSFLAESQGFGTGKDMLWAFYEDKWSNERTAKHLGVCVNTIAKWKQRLKVPVMGPQGWPKGKKKNG